MTFILVLIMAFMAGFIDAVVGGGGLIQFPTLLFYLPNTSLASIFGTNKLAGFAGTSVAAFKYYFKTKINWKAVAPAMATALIFGVLGAKAVSLLDKNIMKPMVLVLLTAVAIYTFVKKDFGLIKRTSLSPQKTIIYSFITGAALGFYDGFFGPGTGSFLVFIFIGVFGFDFLHASAAAKIINCVTNIAALSFFALNDNIIYEVAIPVGIANIVGSVIGTNMAIKKGSGFIRVLFLCVVVTYILKMVYEFYFANA